MNTDQIPALRLHRHFLSSYFDGNPVELLEYFGAMQAQDYPMVKIAIGSRLRQSTLDSITEAFDHGSILRTHVLRPTWHVVAAGNISWMIDLTAPRLKSSMNTRHRELGLSPQLLGKCLSILEKELAGNRHLSREEIVKRLQQDGIDTSANRSSHILMLAELEKLVCSGRDKGGKATYALFGERVPLQSAISREEALARLALMYFTSHGPATLQDFSWWSGQNLGDANLGLEQVKNQLVCEEAGDQSYWMAPGLPDALAVDNHLILLPAYDEYIISYRDRELVIPAGRMSQAVSSNGLFWPVILHNGKVIGTWSRTILRNTLTVKADFFSKPGKPVRTLFGQQVTELGNFFGMKTVTEITG